MKQTKKHSILRVFLIQGIIFLLIIVVATLGYTFRVPIQIAYHKNRENAAQNARHKSWKPEGPHDSYDRHQSRWLHHKKALLELGYRQRHAYQTQYLKQGSIQEKKFFEHFRKKYPRSSYSVGWSSSGLEIEDLTERMPVWDELVRKYDVSIDDPCQPNAPEARR